MRQFELRFLDNANAVVHARRCACADDFAAFREGERQSKTHTVEIWDGDRKVARIAKDGVGLGHADWFGGQQDLSGESHLNKVVSDHTIPGVEGRIGAHGAELAAVTRHWSVLAGQSPDDMARFFSNLRLLPRFPVGTELVFTSDTRAVPKLVLSGWAMSYFVRGDGDRQIIDFHLPGDLVQGVTFGRIKTVIQKVALTDLQLADFDEALADTGPDLALARSMYAHIRTQEFERHVMRIASLGCQGAKAKVAALFMDWYYRLEKVGIGRDGLFTAPVTQELIGEALGLSAVHINRVVHDLRHDGIIRMNHREIEILDAEWLAASAGRN